MSTRSGEFDLAVVGAGPAGTAAAITAARLGMRVVLLEAGSYPRHKVCGEFISPESLDLLRDLLGPQHEAQSVLSSAPIIGRTRLYLGGRALEGVVDPPALSITRRDLDLALWRAAGQCGVRCCSSSEVMQLEGDGPFTLTTRAGTFKGKSLIVAAGRWSRFARHSSVPSGSKWIGLKAHFRESGPSLSTDLYFFDGGYCGVQPVADDTVNACAMVRSDQASTLAEVFAANPALAARAGRWTAALFTVSTAPLIYRTPVPVQGNAIFAGDAAGFIDPFVGDGISIALRTGCAAARCLRSSFTGHASLAESVRRYGAEYQANYAPLLQAASRVRRLLSLPALARAAAFECLRIPGVLPFVIRSTRRAA